MEFDHINTETIYMQLENIISIQPKKILAQVCYEAELGKFKLRPCFSERLPANTKIECHRDFSKHKIGETIEIELVEMLSSNGRSYLYGW